MNDGMSVDIWMMEERSEWLNIITVFEWMNEVHKCVKKWTEVEMVNWMDKQLNIIVHVEWMYKINKIRPEHNFQQWEAQRNKGPGSAHPPQSSQKAPNLTLPLWLSDSGYSL